MRIIFMGTPDFAVPSLRTLAKIFEVVGVVTRPDAVRSRGKKLEPSPIKRLTGELGLTVFEINRMTPEILYDLQALQADCICVAAFGCILPDSVLTLTPLGCYNVHASLLPRWRGAAPIQRAVLAGDETAGVSIMRVVSQLDAGAYCAQRSTTVADKPCVTLMDELAELGAQALAESLPRIVDGTAVWTEQDETLVTYAPKIEKSEMLLDPTQDIAYNLRRVQASTDAAPARCRVGEKGVRILKAQQTEADAELNFATNVKPGEVLIAHGHILLGCADGLLEVQIVKPDGKRAMEARAWATGLKDTALRWECA